MRRNKELEKQALEILEKAIPNTLPKVKSIKQIHNGYTNYSFLVTLDSKEQYQVRIPHSGDLINRKIEFEVLKLSDNNNFVYFDPETGNAVKKWVSGANPSNHKAKTYGFAQKLFPIIKRLHSLEIDESVIKIEKIGINKFNQYLSTLPFEYQKKYLCLCDRRRKDKLVLNHSDINPLNLVVDKEGFVSLIDFEWSCLASDYWDYANYVRETNFDYENFKWSYYIDNFSMETLRDYLFLSSTFAYLWSFAMPQTKKIISYRKTTLKQLKKYYKGVLKHEQVYYN